MFRRRRGPHISHVPRVLRRLHGLTVYYRAQSHLDESHAFIETTNVRHYQMQWCDWRDIRKVMAALKALDYPSVNYRDHWNPFVRTTIEVWFPYYDMDSFERLGQMILNALTPLEEAARKARRR